MPGYLAHDATHLLDAEYEGDPVAEPLGVPDQRTRLAIEMGRQPT